MAVPRDNLRFLRNLPKVRFDEEPRGYSKAQVDRVLENIAPVADAIEDLQSRLNVAEERAVTAEGRAATSSARLHDAEAEIARLNAAALATAAEAASVVATPRFADPVPAFAEEAPMFAAPEPTVLEAHSSEPIASEPVVAAVPSLPPIDHEYDETLRNTLLLAQRTADTTVRDANEEATRLVSGAKNEADMVVGAARDEADTLLAAAKAEHDALETSLVEQRTARLAELDQDILDRRNELEAALLANEGAQRDRLVQEVSDLEQIRDLLIEDIDRFEEHLVTRREVVRAALGSLNELVDGEDGFDSEDVPEPSETPVFDPDDYEAVAVDLPDGVENGASNAPSVEGFLFGEGPASSIGSSATDDAFDGSATQLYEVVLTDDADAFDDDDDLDDADLDDDSDDEPNAFAAFSDDDADDDDADDDDADDDDAPVGQPAFGTAIDADADSGAARPAWADAVPPETPVASSNTGSIGMPTPKGQPSSVSDPFLDELRRATESDQPQGEAESAEAEALSRFLDADEGGGRTGWFGRRK